MNKTKNLYLIKIKLKIQSKRSFITFYRILQAYSDKTFCWFSLLKRPNAKAIGLPRLMLGESLILTLCP
ncbi:hypothetical protein BB385_01830 [Helicobacter pylori]|nr:hypothetical protein B0X40_05390 [Helicobacter pylori]PDW85405.1 hypothetical protein BB385_01830 [Helicobacter pylori]